MTSDTKETTSLFRPEVTEKLSQQSLGSIRLAQPISAWVIVGVALALAISLVAFAGWGEMTKKARVTGITIPLSGTISVASGYGGLLLHSHVKEGDQIEVGQILFELSNERQSDKGEITALVEQQIAARQQSLEAEQRLRRIQAIEKQQTLQLRLTNLENETLQLEQEIKLIERRQSLAQDTLNKFQTLQGNGYVSSVQTQLKQEELLEVATRLSTLKRAQLQQQANQISLKAELQQISTMLATDQAQLERALASLQQERAENRNRKSILISASQAGIVTAISAQTGHIINPGQVLATIVPKDTTNPGDSFNSELEAHLFAPSRTAGFVAKGQKVLIRYAAFPYQKFGLQQGTVVNVSSTPFAPSELPTHLASTILSNAQQTIQGFNGNEALYRIRVKLDQQSIQAYGTKQAVKPGMTLEADIVQDRRKIWEWIIEPILAVAQRER